MKERLAPVFGGHDRRVRDPNGTNFCAQRRSMTAVSAGSQILDRRAKDWKSLAEGEREIAGQHWGAGCFPPAEEAARVGPGSLSSS